MNAINFIPQHEISAINEKLKALEKKTSSNMSEIYAIKTKIKEMKQRRNETFNANIQAIFDEIKKVYLVDVTSSTRRRSVVLYRQCLIYLIHRNFNITLQDIGRLFGRFDHSTVIHSIDKVAGYLDIGDEYCVDAMANVREIFDKYFTENLQN